MMSIRRRAALGLALALSGWRVATAETTAWPAGKPITIVVPFPAGGVTDSLARALAERLAVTLKTSVIVDNRPGGMAQIAVSIVKQSVADGRSIFVGDIGAFALNASLYPKLNYDPLRDLLPLARLARAPTLLVVPASGLYKTVGDLLAAIKARPEAVSVASQGNGTIGHIFAEMLQARAQGKVTHVPYKGSAPALQDLLGGQVQAMLDPVASSGPYVTGGRLRALAVSTAERLPGFAAVPTFDELGFHELALTPWFGAALKAGTPEDIDRTLQDHVRAALVSPDMSTRLADLSLQPAPVTGAEFAAFIKTETSTWAKVIRDGGIRLE